MTTQKQLNDLLRRICDKTGKANSRKQAESHGMTSYIMLDYASAYGGYRIETVNMPNMSRSGAFGGNGCEARMKSKEMEGFMRGILAGLEAAKELVS
jgi:hypothetical protein